MVIGDKKKKKKWALGSGRCCVPDAPAYEYVEPDRGAGLWTVVPPIVPPAGRPPGPGRTWPGSGRDLDQGQQVHRNTGQILPPLTSVPGPSVTLTASACDLSTIPRT